MFFISMVCYIDDRESLAGVHLHIYSFAVANKLAEGLQWTRSPCVSIQNATNGLHLDGDFDIWMADEELSGVVLWGWVCVVM